MIVYNPGNAPIIVGTLRVPPKNYAFVSNVSIVHGTDLILEDDPRFPDPFVAGTG